MRTQKKNVFFSTHFFQKNVFFFPVNFYWKNMFQHRSRIVFRVINLFRIVIPGRRVQDFSLRVCRVEKTIIQKVLSKFVAQRTSKTFFEQSRQICSHKSAVKYQKKCLSCCQVVRNMRKVASRKKSKFKVFAFVFTSKKFNAVDIGLQNVKIGSWCFSFVSFFPCKIHQKLFEIWIKFFFSPKPKKMRIQVSKRFC